MVFEKRLESVLLISRGVEVESEASATGELAVMPGFLCVMLVDTVAFLDLRASNRDDVGTAGRPTFSKSTRTILGADRLSTSHSSA